MPSVWFGLGLYGFLWRRVLEDVRVAEMVLSIFDGDESGESLFLINWSWLYQFRTGHVCVLCDFGFDHTC